MFDVAEWFAEGERMRAEQLAAALAIELVPGATLFPTWTAVVLSLPTHPPVEQEEK